ncbi:MAG: hypothetical protein H7A24_08700 [Leptospiraceae bacterium]|nr:hypothetical protein [Leptospiraceae bacterium]MCP5511946.1 hypothetical protein [Leptospiraceae bacterium]
MKSKFGIFIIFAILTWNISLSAKCLGGNCENGYGTAEFPRGDIYTGEWKDGMASGRGVLKYKNGNEYTGEWKNGKANGRGVLIFQDGTRYVGEWKDSVAHGNGTMYDDKGKMLFTAVWNNGKVVEESPFNQIDSR